MYVCMYVYTHIHTYTHVRTQAAKGLAEQARVMCFKAEIALRRGGALQLQMGLDSLLSLKNAHTWTSSTALSMWAVFDGGWGRLFADADSEASLWGFVRKLVQLLLREMVVSHSTQKNVQQVCMCVCIYICICVDLCVYMYICGCVICCREPHS